MPSPIFSDEQQNEIQKIKTEHAALREGLIASDNPDTMKALNNLKDRMQTIINDINQKTQKIYRVEKPVDENATRELENKQLEHSKALREIQSIRDGIAEDIRKAKPLEQMLPNVPKTEPVRQQPQKHAPLKQQYYGSDLRKTMPPGLAERIKRIESRCNRVEALAAKIHALPNTPINSIKKMQLNRVTHKIKMEILLLKRQVKNTAIRDRLDLLKDKASRVTEPKVGQNLSNRMPNDSKPKGPGRGFR